MREPTTAQTIVKPSFAPLASGLLQRACACGRHTADSAGECEECKKKRQRTLQRATVNNSSINQAPPIVYEVLRSPGKPLDVATRAFIEPRFGQDFSQVKVHTDEKAAASARAVNALAYTVGPDIVFGAGQFAPATFHGRRLLAHELAHTIQQGQSVQPQANKLAMTFPDDSAEREAEAAANAISSDQFSQPVSFQHIVLARQPDLDAGVPGGGSSSPSTPPPVTATADKCALDKPQACRTYGDWLDTFPAPTPAGGADKKIAASMPADLANLIGGKLSAGGGIPDCADVAILLRHYYLKARGESFEFMVGRDRRTAITYTLGKSTGDKEIRACMSGAGTESFQETRSGFALVNFYKEKGNNILNLKRLLAKNLKAGDVFVWKRLPAITGNFQGHAQTVQTVSPPVPDPKDPTIVAKEGFVAVVQGNMSGGQGTGTLEQRVYSFVELTGKRDGDADIGEEPRNHEESFFGAGPWKT